jgi:murein DD-endopeptidase MepM/ murein hydrolase activator NlpD
MGARRLTRATFAVLISSLTAAGVLASPSATGQPPATLEQQIAAADAQLRAAQTALAKKFEAFTAAEQRHQRADKAAKAAAAKAARARAEAAAAAKQESDRRQQFDQFASASFNEGTNFSAVSLTAFLGSDSPSNLLDRAAMLDVLAGEYNDVMAATQQAVDQKSAAERTARASLTESERDRDTAAKARTEAKVAYESAVTVQDSAKVETEQLAKRRADLVARQAAQARAAQPAPSAPPAESGTGAAAPAPAPSGSSGSGSSGSGSSGSGSSGSGSSGSGSSGSGSSGSGSSGGGGGGAVSSSGVVKPAQGTLTSTYGARWGTVHYGIDIANSIGTPILSAMAGEVIDSGPASGFGLWVRVQHANGLITVYGHINESLVSVGQRVGAGQQIATMGNRGQSTGPHLHFEVHDGGSKIDPLPWLRARGVNI